MNDAPRNWLDVDPSSFRKERFVMVGEDDGSWTIVDRDTNIAAIWDDQMLFGLPFDVADDLLETMNRMAVTERGL